MDSGIRIDNAAPALPSATTLKPAFGVRLQAHPAGAPQKIEKLEHRDLFFSSQSARSHVERYLAEHNAHRLSFRFERQSSDGWLSRALNHPGALLLVEKNATQLLGKPVKGHARPAEKLGVRLLEFEEIIRTPLLQKALLAVSAEPYKVQRFAFVPKTGELHPEAAFKEQGIAKQARPGWHNLMDWLRQKMPYRPEQSLPLGVDESLGLRIGRRMRWAPAEQWRDKDNNPVQVMDLMRLDNARMAQVVQIREQTDLEKTSSLPLGRPDLRKSWRDKVLGLIGSVEERGYFMQPGHIRQTHHTRRKTAAPPRHLAAHPARKISLKPAASNPFSTVSFSGNHASVRPPAKPSDAKPIQPPKNNPFHLVKKPEQKD